MGLVLEASRREVRAIDSLMDELARLAPGLRDGDAYRSVFVAEQASASEIMRLMMFYEAAGGLAFAGLPNDYQDYCDLSRMLDLGRAILVANVLTGGSRLVDHRTGQPFGDQREL